MLGSIKTISGRPVRISRWTGVPSGRSILCREMSLKTRSGTHRVVAVR